MIVRRYGGGSRIVIEQEERRGHGGGEDCPICRGKVSCEFVAMIEQATSEPGKVMTFDETMAWLRSL